MPHPDWPGWTRQQTLILPIPASRWALPAHGVALDGIDFAPKRELHVTLIGRALGKQLRAAIGRGVLEFADIREMFEAQDWNSQRSDEYLLLRKREPARGRSRTVHSVIQLLEMPAMAGFHGALGERLGVELPLPPPHVTLYVAGTRQGIGVPDAAALRALRQRSVDPAELRAR